MAYMDYNYSVYDTFESIAHMFNISIDELMLINNIQPPYPERPVEVNYLDNTLKVPDIFSGGETFENINKKYYASKYNQTPTLPEIDQRLNAIATPISYLGSAVQGKCLLSVQGVDTIAFPCYPDSYSETHQASVVSQSPLGRSEPFQIYQNTGPRTVSVSFRMDREMARTSDIGYIVGVVQSAVYPIGAYPIIPRCTLVIGNNCSITGIIDNVSTNWSDTIINDQFMVATIDFSVIECTGSPKLAPAVAGRAGR